MGNNIGCAPKFFLRITFRHYLICWCTHFELYPMWYPNPWLQKRKVTPVASQYQHCAIGTGSLCCGADHARDVRLP